MSRSRSGNLEITAKSGSWSVPDSCNSRQKGPMRSTHLHTLEISSREVNAELVKADLLFSVCIGWTVMPCV